MTNLRQSASCTVTTLQTIATHALAFAAGLLIMASLAGCVLIPRIVATVAHQAPAATCTFDGGGTIAIGTFAKVPATGITYACTQDGILIPVTLTIPAG